MTSSNRKPLTFSLAWMNVSMKNETDNCAAIQVMSGSASSVCGMWPQICHMKLKRDKRLELCVDEEGEGQLT